MGASGIRPEPAEAARSVATSNAQSRRRSRQLPALTNETSLAATRFATSLGVSA